MSPPKNLLINHWESFRHLFFPALRSKRHTACFTICLITIRTGNPNLLHNCTASNPHHFRRKRRGGMQNETSQKMNHSLRWRDIFLKKKWRLQNLCTLSVFKRCPYLHSMWNINKHVDNQLPTWRKFAWWNTRLIAMRENHKKKTQTLPSPSLCARKIAMLHSPCSFLRCTSSGNTISQEKIHLLPRTPFQLPLHSKQLEEGELQRQNTKMQGTATPLLLVCFVFFVTAECCICVKPKLAQSTPIKCGQLADLVFWLVKKYGPLRSIALFSTNNKDLRFHRWNWMILKSPMDTQHFG